MEKMDNSVLGSKTCFSCGCEDKFCNDNSSHLCKVCFGENFILTKRRAEQIKAIELAKTALLTSYEEVCKKYSAIQESFQAAATKLSEVTKINFELEKRIGVVNANLEAVVASNAELIKKISELEEQLKSKD